MRSSCISFTKKERTAVCAAVRSFKVCRIRLGGREFVVVLRVAGALRFLDGFEQGSHERLGSLRVAVDLRIVAVAAFEGVGEGVNEFCNGARVIGFSTGAAASFGDRVSFRHFLNLFEVKQWR